MTTFIFFFRGGDAERCFQTIIKMVILDTNVATIGDLWSAGATPK